MIMAKLDDKIVSVTYLKNTYYFTNENGQVQIESILKFLEEINIEELEGPIDFQSTDNPQLDSGLRLFITELFNNLAQEKSKMLEDKEDIQ